MLQFCKDLQDQENVFYPMVKCFHVLTCKLPGQPLGKRVGSIAFCLGICLAKANQGLFQNIYLV